ncbi:MAG TPA: alpha/beta fold hydrolase [Vicinamibacterales bacterium]|nr:alpha/beta fold hydrolase [Vicinamibacterales bacterium]
MRYHRRGYAGSSPVRPPFSLSQQAADCRALLGHLRVERTHVVGHSSGGSIALQLALDAPEVVHSLVLLEPALLTFQAEPCSPRRSDRRWSGTVPATRRARPTASFAGRSGQTTEPGSID